MSQNPRCLYNNSFAAFLRDSAMSILGTLCNNYHGEARTTTREAWKAEIDIMQEVLSQCDDQNGHIVFEYDIPRLGKRVDVVLLYKGIIFCIEFKKAKKNRKRVFALLLVFRARGKHWLGWTLRLSRRTRGMMNRLKMKAPCICPETDRLWRC